MFLVEYCEKDRIFDIENGFNEMMSVVLDLDSIFECVDWVCNQLEFVNENSEKYYFIVYQCDGGARVSVFRGDKEYLYRSSKGNLMSL